MTTRQKTNLTLPDEARTALASVKDDDTERGLYMANLRHVGWTLSSIADAAGLSRERVRQIVAHRGFTTIFESMRLPLPLPPEKGKPKAVYAQPRPETLARLQELQPIAQKARRGTRYQDEREEYTRLINQARTVEGVSLYRLAKILGVTHAALRFRLVRYGYMTSRTGTSDAYRPISETNRPKR